MGIMGWSFGGIVTMLALSRSTAFLVAIDQAGGALTWDRNAHVRVALIASAKKAETPTLFMVANNDRTTSSVTTLAEIFKKRGIPHRVDNLRLVYTYAGIWEWSAWSCHVLGAGRECVGE